MPEHTCEGHFCGQQGILDEAHLTFAATPEASIFAVETTRPLFMAFSPQADHPFSPSLQVTGTEASTKAGHTAMAMKVVPMRCMALPSAKPCVKDCTIAQLHFIELEPVSQES